MGVSSASNPTGLPACLFLKPEDSIQERSCIMSGMKVLALLLAVAAVAYAEAEPEAEAFTAEVFTGGEADAAKEKFGYYGYGHLAHHGYGYGHLGYAHHGYGYGYPHYGYAHHAGYGYAHPGYYGHGYGYGHGYAHPYYYKNGEASNTEADN